ncbi:hypothetical protein D3C72_2309540 [compost metagenome]
MVHIGLEAGFLTRLHQGVFAQVPLEVRPIDAEGIDRVVVEADAGRNIGFG